MSIDLYVWVVGLIVLKVCGGEMFVYFVMILLEDDVNVGLIGNIFF